MGRLYIHQDLHHWTGCPAGTFYRRKLHSRPHIGISPVEGTSSLVRTFLIEALSRDRYLQDTLHKPRLGFQCQEVSERSFLEEIPFPFLNFSLPRNCYISPVPLHLTAPLTLSTHPSPHTHHLNSRKPQPRMQSHVGSTRLFCLSPTPSSTDIRSWPRLRNGESRNPVSNRLFKLPVATGSCGRNRRGVPPLGRRP